MRGSPSGSSTIRETVASQAIQRAAAAEMVAPNPVSPAPGPVVADPATLPFRNLRPGLRLRPGTNQAFAPGERPTSGGD